MTVDTSPSHDLYTDKKVQSAVKELFSNKPFVDGMNSFLPEELSSKFLQSHSDITSSYDFQAGIIHPLLQFIKAISMTKLTSSGLDILDKNKKYLFVSNHRDIGLDSAFLNLQLFDNGHTTSQIAIGDNLTKHRIAELIFRINKSFIVQRSGAPRELYQASINLSKYIRKTIESKKDSIWIAQREGRAKDGNDFTQVALLKMLGLSGGKDLKEHFSALNIVPVAISYEYDPCDALKTKEHIDRKLDPDYQKSFDADMRSILQGLKGKKGNVHVAFGRPIKKAINELNESFSGKELLSRIAGLIDQQIHELYKLNPINYIAYDLMKKSYKFSGKYSTEEKAAVQEYFNSRLDKFPATVRREAIKYYLGIYANPVINKK